jgi:hypothetical protein
VREVEATKSGFGIKRVIRGWVEFVVIGPAKSCPAFFRELSYSDQEPPNAGDRMELGIQEVKSKRIFARLHVPDFVLPFL